MFSVIFFTIKTLQIFLCEYIKYLLLRDYEGFIHNVAEKLSRENILYVKVFQAIALNKYSINETINNELIKFADKSPYTQDDINLPLIEKILREYNLIGDIYRPINSGMISLVYKMKNADNNTDVIIKMKRNKIDEKLNNAIANILSCVAFFAFFERYIPIFDIFSINKTIQQKIHVIRQQLDFGGEVSNMKRMRENCKYMPNIVVPMVYEEVTRENKDIIMMEYIRGVSILHVSPEDYDIYAKMITKFGFACLLHYGFAHGDMHSGNVLFIKEYDQTKSEKENPIYKLGIIDFGIMITLGDEFKNRILNICVKFFDSPARESAMDLFSIIIHPKEAKQMLDVHHYANIITMFEKCIDEAFLKSKKNPDQTQLYLLFNELNSYLSANDLKNYGLSISDDFVNLQIALAMGQGVTLHLTKNNFNSIINDSIKEMFHSDLFLDTN